MDTDQTWPSFDFSKAYNSVPHQHLLIKLDHYGIRGKTKEWISLFLLERSQRVVLNGAQLRFLLVLSGVSQGTVLGPLLFLLYINDITDGISFEIRLFADDCILYRQIRAHVDYHTTAGHRQAASLVWFRDFLLPGIFTPRSESSHCERELSLPGTKVLGNFPGTFVPE